MTGNRLTKIHAVFVQGIDVRRLSILVTSVATGCTPQLISKDVEKIRSLSPIDFILSICVIFTRYLIKFDRYIEQSCKKRQKKTGQALYLSGKERTFI